MLVLSRRPGESVMVGHDVVITVLEVRGDVVRVGIAAPREVQVHREEVHRELQAANVKAAAAADDAVAALAATLGLEPAPGAGTAASSTLDTLDAMSRAARRPARPAPRPSDASRAQDRRTPGADEGGTAPRPGPPRPVPPASAGE